MSSYNDREWRSNGSANGEAPARQNTAAGRISGTFIDSTLRAPSAQSIDVDANGIPDIVIRRLPIYVRTLRKLHAKGVLSVSSEELADHIGVTAAQIRRDLSYFGKFGKQGKGYDTDFLARAIGSILRLDRQWPVVLVGLGNLGRAIAGYRGFTPSSFNIVALFDRNPQNIGMVVNDMEIQSEDHLTEVIARERIKIGILASPSVFAQEVADKMVEGGVEAILNYAPVILKVPDYVTIRDIDPVTALQSMTYYLSNRERVPAPR
jgi:redox-sensing transcriptional repressor